MSNTARNTRQRILEVAQDLIQRRGLNAMSFQDLSDAVGIRKASVHHHFASKADLVHALLDQYQETFDALVDSIVQSDVLGKTKMRRYFDIFLRTSRDGKNCMCGMLVAEMFSLDETGLVKVNAFLHSNFVAIRSILHDGIEDGSFEESLQVSGTAEMILATLEGGLFLTRCDGGSQRLADMLNRMLTLL